jgi:hypothetical protein
MKREGRVCLLLLRGGLLGDLLDGEPCDSRHNQNQSAKPASITFNVEPEGTATDAPGGKLCLSFSALSASSRTRVYKYFEQRILNFVTLLRVGWEALVVATGVRKVVFLIRAAGRREIEDVVSWVVN